MRDPLALRLYMCQLCMQRHHDSKPCAFGGAFSHGKRLMIQGNFPKFFPRDTSSHSKTTPHGDSHNSTAALRFGTAAADLRPLGLLHFDTAGVQGDLQVPLLTTQVLRVFLRTTGVHATPRSGQAWSFLRPLWLNMSGTTVEVAVRASLVHWGMFENTCLASSRFELGSPDGPNSESLHFQGQM